MKRNNIVKVKKKIVSDKFLVYKSHVDVLCIPSPVSLLCMAYRYVYIRIVCFHCEYPFYQMHCTSA